MSTHPAFLAPIGSVLAWSDGTPRPPERHRKRLSAWRSHNSSGQLVSRQGEYRRGSMIVPATFRLHEGDHGAGGVIAIRIYRSFSLDSSLSFSIIEVPAIGSCRVFDRAGENAELVHLAASRQAAEEWLTRHGYPSAVLEDVTADEVASNAGQGRAVA
ncbi:MULTISPECIES: hypothetical protein [Rhizobium]|uniref:Uncharacterized protein n=1 Tax=Rhizobium wenxiniae TaxID=1737357 RepID=A0A7W9YD38_9HYPH|nr:hypothetical protein [Rhizobium wenxiniae]MBB6165683.1 hypothetical protein [Rhizobium wenxiniae]GGG16675.1 hypothetical protein GCM10010924_52150 [Rhizobium wenxiniae]